MLIECSNIKKSYAGHSVLKNVSFKVNDNDKISIIGVNGAGKTTLLRILLKEEDYDEGDLFENKDLTIGCLSQQPLFDMNKTIYQTALDVFSTVIQLEEKMRQLELEMTDHHSSDILDEYDRVSHHFQELDGFSYPSLIKGVLKGMGFSEDEFMKTIDELSGGQKTRLALAKLLLEQPRLLILDEPTNHLDSQAITFLENYLKGYKHAVIVVSHDRYFINQVSNKIVEIENGKSKTYQCNYDQYAILKKANRDVELRHYINQQKEIKKMQESIDTLKSFNREKSVKRARSKEKQLEKIERIDKPETLPDEIRISFHPKNESGYDVLKTENLVVGYEETVLDHINIDIKRQEKVAIIGQNGIGKTTLFKALLGQLPITAGKIKLGAKVDIAYYDQEHANLSFDKTVFKEIGDTYPRMTNTEIRNNLALFNFRNDDVFKQINDLSGGEKGRVVLTKILLQQANLLILDEPTNHLDISSKEVLEDALIDFEGTVVFISHDRYFINKVATRIIEITPHGAISHNGNYDQYLMSISSPLPAKEHHSDYQEKKKQQAVDKRTRNKIKKLETQISQLEETIVSKTELLKSDEYMNDYVKYNDLEKDINTLEQSLEDMMNEWELLQE